MEKHTCWIYGKEHNMQHERDYFCSEKCKNNYELIGDHSIIFEDNIVCPYCGHEMNPNGEYDAKYDNEYEIECESCEQVFEMETHHRVTYSVTPRLAELLESKFMDEDDE